MLDLLFCLEVRTARADARVVEELLAAVEIPCATWEEPEAPETVFSIYATTQAEAEATDRRVRTALREFVPAMTTPPTFRILPLNREDWAESWKRHFQVVRVTPRLTIRPVWIEHAAQPGEIVLPINPGMAFGTGNHGTTRACLEFIDALGRRLLRVEPTRSMPPHAARSLASATPVPAPFVPAPGPRTAFLDVGCGSGILALAAARLGFAPVLAIDNDAQAVSIARENCSAAGAAQVQAVCADLAAFTPPCPVRVVAANLLAPVLIQHAPRLISFLDRGAPGGFLILSGILTEQYEEVRATYELHGCHETGRRTLDAWTSGCFGLCG